MEDAILKVFQTHNDDFAKMVAKKSIPKLIDGFGGLLPEAQGEDYEEQNFANKLRKKKRRLK